MARERELAHGVRLVVAYDGTDFAGWQRQPGQRTVQSTLGGAVHGVTVHRTRLRGASRTDAGVHALGQVASFACDRELPPDAWIHELNRRLPEDASVAHAEPCAADYDPRHDATGKTYRYLMRVGRVRDPLTRHRAWQVGPQLARRRATRAPFPSTEDYLDVVAMAEAAAALEGAHDFRAFQASNDDREETVRTLHRVDVMPGFGGRRDLLAVEVEGNAFLKNMVRILAGTLLDVGRGKRTPEAISDLLTPQAERGAAGPTAPAHGLTLVQVHLGRRAPGTAGRRAGGR
ncbi:MAG: tRNA pseudouridine(38-40) synthase TruA [Myxococcota bacterium]